jgi:hypothetical protein
MKRIWIPSLALAVCLPLAAWATARAVSSQDEPNYLVMSMYELAPGQTFSAAAAEVSQWARILRASGHYKSVRLFVHDYGPELAFYVLAEPNDWASIPAGFAALLEAQPDLLDQPWNFQSHSDNILTEIPLE